MRLGRCREVLNLFYGAREFLLMRIYFFLAHVTRPCK